jgi:hypothetical protein
MIWQFTVYPSATTVLFAGEYSQFLYYMQKKKPSKNQFVALFPAYTASSVFFHVTMSLHTLCT